MLIQNGFYDIKPEAHAVFVLAAGFVALVEPFKQQRKFFGRYGIALILNGDQRFAAPGTQRQLQCGSLRREFGGVFQKIVDYLGNQVGVTQHPHRLVGDFGGHIESAVHDFLFHGNNGAAHALTDIKALFIADHIAGLQAGDIQHAAHQAGQTLGFIRNGLEVLVGLFRRNCAVEDAVGITANGGHGGL